jgi:uncharacterized protein YndB with AHSA1/START domain
VEYRALRYADTPTVEVEAFIKAPPARVWELVADPELMPSLSDELCAVTWLDGATKPALGARFRGTNRHAALGEWTTTSFIVEFETERAFAWAVEDPTNPTAVWRFALTPDGEGTRLTQWMQMGPGRSGLNAAIDRMPDKEKQIVFVRLREFEGGMAKTLALIKARLEGGQLPATHGD